ncbi:hypothetical protein CEP52_004231 [Fusarium oligoseptatum]|uniref:Uncharacterized protein n=1 Tax=Fusarium oligoseptatum TaxID=2604345 RepID=A0A428U497_9HYPO|nr:hypothetical protein CEP52_004231 [Fusarium oligoseptatum]
MGQPPIHNSSLGATSANPVIVLDDQDMIVISDDENDVRPVTQEGTPQEQAVSSLVATDGDLPPHEGTSPQAQDALSTAGGRYKGKAVIQDAEDDSDNLSDYQTNIDTTTVDKGKGKKRHGKKRERAHSPTTSDSPGPSTRRRRDVTNAVTSSSSSAPALASASAGHSSLTAPRWGSDRSRDGFLTQFKAIYQRDQAAFYAHVDWHYQDYLEMKRRYRFNDYSDYIASNFGETRCFSGIFHAFPNASLTLYLQALMTPRHSAGGSIYYMNQTVSIIDIRHLFTGGEWKTRTCTWAFCINPLHFTSKGEDGNRARVECFQRTKERAERGFSVPKESLQDRSKCAQHAKERAEKGLQVSKHCKAGHNPPCLLQQAATPAATKGMIEYEALGHAVPEDFPRQGRATKGAFLLTEDPNIYRWEGDALVVDGGVSMPEIEEETTQGKPEELECSPSRFGNFCFRLPVIHGVDRSSKGMTLHNYSIL